MRSLKLRTKLERPVEAMLERTDNCTKDTICISTWSTVSIRVDIPRTQIRVQIEEELGLSLPVVSR